MSKLDFAFLCFALISIVGGLLVVLLRNVLHAAFSLIGALFGVAGLYALLAADFLAVTQLIVYIGGVVILIVFAIMLSEWKEEQPSRGKEFEKKLVLASTIGMVILITLYLSVVRAPWKVAVSGEIPRTTIYSLGDLLLSTYVLPFEVASLLLLAALVGAVIIARQKGI